MDETMFGGRRAGKRGWGASGKIIVFGIYQRNRKVLTFPISSRAKETMMPYIIKYTKTEKHNAASIPKYKKLNRFFVKTGMKNSSVKILGEAGKKKLKKFVFEDKKIPKIKNEDKAFLLKIYKEDILKTQEIINKDLSSWLQL